MIRRGNNDLPARVNLPAPNALRRHCDRLHGQSFANLRRSETQSMVLSDGACNAIESSEGGDMKQKIIKFNLEIPADARRYIKYFNSQNKKSFPGGINMVTLNTGREIHFENMTDDDAILVANGFAEMAHQSQKNRKLN